MNRFHPPHYVSQTLKNAFVSNKANIIRFLVSQSEGGQALLLIYKAEKPSVRLSVRHADNSPGSAYSDLSTV